MLYFLRLHQGEISTSSNKATEPPLTSRTSKWHQKDQKETGSCGIQENQEVIVYSQQPIFFGQPKPFLYLGHILTIVVLWKEMLPGHNRISLLLTREQGEGRSIDGGMSKVCFLGSKSISQN